MSKNPGYTTHHPRWLRPRVSTYWWLERWSYLSFILRELSSIFIAWFVVYLLLLIRAVVGGEAAYRRFLDSSGNPVIVVANLISLVFVVFHAITWFNLAPRAIVVRIAGRRVPEALVVASNYIALALCSGIVVWLVLGE